MRMGRRIRDYVKYTLPELEIYTKRAKSCIKKVHNNIHLNMQPHALENIKKAVLRVIDTKKIGFFNVQLNGIILEIKNIKILDVAPISHCDPNVHLNIEADFYIFQPEVGAVVRGVVKYISDRQIGVIIYRVFSVAIRLQHKVEKALELNSEIEFRIKNFDLKSVMPFIEGELVASEVKRYDKALVKQIPDAPSSQNKTSVKQIKIFEESDSSTDSDKAANSPNFTSLARSISPYPEDQNADAAVKKKKRAKTDFSDDIVTKLIKVKKESSVNINVTGWSQGLKRKRNISTLATLSAALKKEVKKRKLSLHNSFY